MIQYRTLSYPPTVFWEVTPLCNHNCVHCFNYWRKDREETTEINGFVKEKTYLEFAEKIISFKPASVVITGGEPLLIWDKIRTCIELFKKNKIEVSMNTNAVLMTEEIAEFLKENNIPLLVSYPCCVEDICNEITDTPGAWQRINEGLDILVKNNNRFSCNMVVSRKNIDYVKETALFLKEKFNIKHISLSRVGKPVNASKEFDGYLLTQKDIRRLIEESTTIYKEYRMSVEASAPYPTCALETQEEYDIYARKRLCSAGKSSYVIGSDGNLKACPRDSTIYGNIFEEEFSVIWNRLEEWRDGSLYPGECKECKNLTECFGGCRADMLAENGHCKGLDSAARIEKLPLDFKPTEAAPMKFSDDTKFQVSDLLIAVKDGDGYRLSVSGVVTYVTETAYEYLNTHKQFSVREFKEKMLNGINADGILIQLLNLRIITIVNI